jgi:hypothetical protein
MRLVSHTGAYNIGRQQGQAKDAADVGPIDLLDASDFRVGCVRVQLLSPAERCPGVGAVRRVLPPRFADGLPYCEFPRRPS